MVVLLVAFGSLGDRHATASPALGDGVWIAASHDASGDAAGSDHLNGQDCVTQSHCSAPAIMATAATIACEATPDWTCCPQPVWHAVFAAPEGRPPIVASLA